MAMTITILLICICLILLGAITSKPIGYIVCGLAVLALLIAVFGGPNPFR